MKRTLTILAVAMLPCTLFCACANIENNTPEPTMYSEPSIETTSTEVVTTAPPSKSMRASIIENSLKKNLLDDCSNFADQYESVTEPYHEAFISMANIQNYYWNGAFYLAPSASVASPTIEWRSVDSEIMQYRPWSKDINGASVGERVEVFFEDSRYICVTIEAKAESVNFVIHSDDEGEDVTLSFNSDMGHMYSPENRANDGSIQTPNYPDGSVIARQLPFNYSETNDNPGSGVEYYTYMSAYGYSVIKTLDRLIRVGAI